MSLSNRDFDSGVFELSAWLYAMKFPVLCANMWARETSYLYSRVNKSVVLDVAGEKVAIVGYIHRYALRKTKPAVSVVFSPEIPALQKEVRRLEEEGVDKIIALGHAGYYTDLEIARNVKGVDVVMGGDSDILLFDPGNGASGADGNVHGNYPRVHEHALENDTNVENRTLVLHIPRHGHYVGVLRVTFDEKGKIIHESGEPVLLDSRYPQDEETVQFLNTSAEALKQLHEHMRLPDDSEILAKLSDDLNGNPRSCRMSECTMGNFMADAFLHEFTFHYRNGSEHRYEDEHWGPIDAAVFNSGTFLHSLEAGHITIQDILRAVTLGAFIKRVHMSGQQLTDMMEHSVKYYDPKGITPPGCFLQVAGLRVVYDLNRAPGGRVRSLQIRCRDCDDDSYLPVKQYKTYVVAMPSYLGVGGDGFKYFEDHRFDDNGQFDALLLVEYLRRMYNIEPVLDGRIHFYNSLNSDINKAKMPLNIATPQSVPTSSIREEKMADKSDIEIKSQHDLERVNDGQISAKTADFNNSSLTSPILISKYENATDAQKPSANFPNATHSEESLMHVKKSSISDIHDEDFVYRGDRLNDLSGNQVHDEGTVTKPPHSPAKAIETNESRSFSILVNGAGSKEDLNFIKDHFTNVLNSNKGNVSLASNDILDLILSFLKYSNTSDNLYNWLKQAIANNGGYTVDSEDELTPVDLVGNLVKSITSFINRNQFMSVIETSRRQTQNVDNSFDLIPEDESKLEIRQKADYADKSSPPNIDFHAFNVTSMQTLLSKLMLLFSTDDRSKEGLQETVQVEKMQPLLKGIPEVGNLHDWLKNISFSDGNIPYAGRA